MPLSKQPYTISVVTVLPTGVICTTFAKVSDGRIYEWILEHLTFFMGGRLGGVVTGINKSMHENIRRRALKKAAKGK
jgi:hypothetical protein